MFSDFEASHNVTHWIRSSLTVFLGHDFSDEFLISSEALDQVEHVPLSGEEGGFGPGFKGFLWVFNDGVELLLCGLWNLTKEFLGDGVSDGESFLACGFNEFTIDKVFVDSGEGVSVESGEKWHKFQLLIKIR